MHFELAADYLVMASTLAEIKSKLLLPVESDDDDEEDPRANLIKRLLEYQKYKNASERLEEIPRNYRDFYVVTNAIDYQKAITIETPDIKLEQLKTCFYGCLKESRDIFYAQHTIRNTFC